METKRYALFNCYDGYQVSEIVRFTDDEFALAKAAVQWKYHNLYYIDQFNDSYIIKKDDIIAALGEHSEFLENNRKKKAESSRKRKLALYEKLKKELEPTTQEIENNERQTT